MTNPSVCVILKIVMTNPSFVCVKVVIFDPSNAASVMIDPFVLVISYLK